MFFLLLCNFCILTCFDNLLRDEDSASTVITLGGVGLRVPGFEGTENLIFNIHRYADGRM